MSNRVISNFKIFHVEKQITVSEIDKIEKDGGGNGWLCLADGVGKNSYSLVSLSETEVELFFYVCKKNKVDAIWEYFDDGGFYGFKFQSKSGVGLEMEIKQNMDERNFVKLSSLYKFCRISPYEKSIHLLSELVKIND